MAVAGNMGRCYVQRGAKGRARLLVLRLDVKLDDGAEGVVALAARNLNCHFKRALGVEA